MGDRSGMSISADSPSDETLNRGPRTLLLCRQYEFPFGISIVQFSFFFSFTFELILLREGVKITGQGLKSLKAIKWPYHMARSVGLYFTHRPHDEYTWYHHKCDLHNQKKKTTTTSRAIDLRDSDLDLSIKVKGH